MKKLIKVTLVFCLLLAAFSALSQTPVSTITISPGDKLIYEVNFRGDIYNFEVTVRSFGETGIVFNYDMPAKNNSATIDITAGAVKNASTYQNYFNGTDQQFTDKSTVWLSNKNFAELMSAKITMDMGSGNELFTKKEAVSFSFKNGSKEISVDGFRFDNEKSAFDQRQLWILNNKRNPLILKMNLGWTIGLKEIIPAG